MTWMSNRTCDSIRRSRTFFDLAGVVSQQQLEHALNEAEIPRLSSPVPVDALIARHPRPPRARTRAAPPPRDVAAPGVARTRRVEAPRQHGAPRWRTMGSCHGRA